MGSSWVCWFYSFDFSTQEAQAGRALYVQGQPDPQKNFKSQDYREKSCLQKKKTKTLLDRHSLRGEALVWLSFSPSWHQSHISRGRRCLLLTSQRIRKQEVEAGSRYHLQRLPLPLDILQPPKTGPQVGTKFANT